MSISRRQCVAGLLMAAALPCATPASAQDCPARQPIRIVVAQGQDRRPTSWAVKRLANEETIKNLQTAGLEPRSSSPEQFADLIKAESSKWSQIAKSANIALD